MGGAPSKMPPYRIRDPFPGGDGAAVGFSPGQAQGCSKCELVVAEGLSASGAKIYREQGTISARECELFKKDSLKVSNNEMAFDEFKGKLVEGKYFLELENGFCKQIKFTEQQLENVNAPDQIPWSASKAPTIRKLTGDGGFSSITKLFIKPAIPFNMSFNGQPIQVNTMTLFHPCPIRVENIQYDAVLTLGDVADPTAKTVIMIPITGSLFPGNTGTFFSRIASFIPGVLTPKRSGQYQIIDVPTGKDWNISSLFPASPRGIKNLVDEPYYLWNAVPPMELQLTKVIEQPLWFPNIEYYGWRQASSAPLRTFIMLAKPIPINIFDLQTIRMLPATPTEDAIPAPMLTSLVFKPCPPPKSTKEKFVSEKDLACDPFANMPELPSRIDVDAMITATIAVITTIAVCIGIYFAMKYAGQPIGAKLKFWGEEFGKAIGTLGSARVPPVKSSTEKEFQVENPLVKKKLEREAQQKKAEEEKKKEEEKKAQEEAKKKEEEAKQLFEAEETKKKDLLEKMKDTSLSEQEQRKIRKEYQKLTGIYHPTKQEQEAAAGTGLVKKRYIAPEEPDEEDEEEARKMFEELEKEEEAKKKAEAEAKKKAEQEEADAKKKAEEEAKAIEKIKEDARRKAEEKFMMSQLKRRPEFKVPSYTAPKTLGTTNLGLREETAKIPPIPPRDNPLFARVEKLKEKKEELKEKQKTQVQLAREKFEKAKTGPQEDKLKKDLATIKENQEIEKEKIARDLAEAQAKLRQSQTMYYRANQRRNIRTGRGKTMRN